MKTNFNELIGTITTKCFWVLVSWAFYYFFGEFDFENGVVVITNPIRLSVFVFIMTVAHGAIVYYDKLKK